MFFEKNLFVLSPFHFWLLIKVKKNNGFYIFFFNAWVRKKKKKKLKVIWNRLFNLFKLSFIMDVTATSSNYTLFFGGS
jgi:hypothetical protein